MDMTDGLKMLPFAWNFVNNICLIYLQCPQSCVMDKTRSATISPA